VLEGSNGVLPIALVVLGDSLARKRYVRPKDLAGKLPYGISFHHQCEVCRGPRPQPEIRLHHRTPFIEIVYLCGIEGVL
jgi:hypothetical protein